MTEKKYQDKIKQIGDEVDLMNLGLIDRSIWFGTHPFPDEGRGAVIAKLLREAGIKYFHIPWEISD